MTTAMPKSPCMRACVSPSRGSGRVASVAVCCHSSAGQSAATPQNLVGAPQSTPQSTSAIDLSHDKKWQIGIVMQKQLRDAVKVEDFETAAHTRDQLSQLQLSQLQLLEMKMAEQLTEGTYDEKAKSLRKLSQLHPTEETQSLIIDSIKDEALTTVAQQVIQAIWLRHPNNWRVNELLEEGSKSVEMARGCSDVHNSSLQPALASFEEAASLDPTFPETWNKIATVLYLTQQYAESIHACEQVLSLNPQHYLALSGKGLCHFYLQEHREAEKCWIAALQINPFLTQFRRFLSASETGEL